MQGARLCIIRFILKTPSFSFVRRIRKISQRKTGTKPKTEKTRFSVKFKELPSSLKINLIFKFFNKRKSILCIARLSEKAACFEKSSLILYCNFILRKRRLLHYINAGAQRRNGAIYVN